MIWSDFNEKLSLLFQSYEPLCMRQNNDEILSFTGKKQKQILYTRTLQKHSIQYFTPFYV